ncbi:MAG: PP2C family serine/threonine-protein phosphatase [Candidatus Thiodiazotropha sp.]
MIIEVAMRTDKGRVREQNEDAVGGDPEAGLVVLADGMGGANAGEVASGLAVDLLVSQLTGRLWDGGDIDQEQIKDAVGSVNQAILELADQVPDYQGMGTTLVLGLFVGRQLIYAHVGDSRLYRWRQGVLQQLTLDHSLIQEMVNLGDFSCIEEALLAGVPTNVLSRALGSEPLVMVDVEETEWVDGDVFLLCTDGLTGMVTDDEMQSILENKDLNLEEQADELVDFACRMGGIDNISVILVRPQAANDV